MASVYLGHCSRHWLGRGLPLSFEVALASAQAGHCPPILRGLGSDSDRHPLSRNQSSS